MVPVIGLRPRQKGYILRTIRFTTGSQGHRDNIFNKPFRNLLVKRCLERNPKVLDFAFHSLRMAAWRLHADSVKYTTSSPSSYKSRDTLLRLRKLGTVWGSVRWPPY